MSFAQEIWLASMVEDGSAQENSSRRAQNVRDCIARRTVWRLIIWQITYWRLINRNHNAIGHIPCTSASGKQCHGWERALGPSCLHNVLILNNNQTRFISFAARNWHFTFRQWNHQHHRHAEMTQPRFESQNGNRQTHSEIYGKFSEKIKTFRWL